MCLNLIIGIIAIITVGVVYWFDENFPEVAIQEIGEERLKKHLRGE